MFVHVFLYIIYIFIYMFAYMYLYTYIFGARGRPSRIPNSPSKPSTHCLLLLIKMLS